jgi:hypothetical protein
LATLKIAHYEFRSAGRDQFTLIGMVTVLIIPAAVEVTVMIDGPVGVPTTDALPTDVPADVLVVDPPQPARPQAVTASSATVR